MYPNTLHDLSDCDVCLMYAQHVELQQDSEIDNHGEFGPGEPRTIADAIEHGRQLQREENAGLFSRYRGRLNSLQKRCDDDALQKTKAQAEAERLRVELEEMKDHLMALQMAYEEMTLSQLGSAEGVHGWGELEQPQDAEDYSKGQSSTSEHRKGHREDVTAATSSDEETKDNWSDDGDFDVFQQLKLMEQWDKEDADWFEARQKELSEDAESDLEVLPQPAPATAGPAVLVLSTSTLPDMFVDASAHGIGLVFDNMWLAWTFSPRHPHIPLGPDRKPIMSWAELIAVELGVRTLLAANYRNVSITIRSDNEGVVQAFKFRKWIPKFGLDDILQRILRLCEPGGIQLRVKWVWTKANPADNPSRGVYPPSSMMFTHRPDLPQNMIGLVKDVANGKAVV